MDLVNSDGAVAEMESLPSGVSWKELRKSFRYPEVSCDSVVTLASGAPAGPCRVLFRARWKGAQAVQTPMQTWFRGELSSGST